MKRSQGFRFLVVFALCCTISAEAEVQVGNGIIVRRDNFAETSAGQLARPRSGRPASRDAVLFPASTERVVLTLRLYAYVKIDADVLREAKRHADRIFEGSGVGIAWLHCPTSPEQLSSNRACAGPLGPNHLVIKVLPASMSRRYAFSQQIFGFASLTLNGLPGTHISLFHARVLDLAYHGGVGTSFEDAQSIILGHVIAHEIGHLLLGPESHSLSGIMKSPWDRKVLQDMEGGRLHFTNPQQSKILLEIRRRIDLVRQAAQ